MDKDIKVQYISSIPSKENQDSTLYYFDIRNSEIDNGYTIERNVLANNIGSIVCNVDLLKDKEFITDEEFEKLNPIIVNNLINENEMEME